MPTPVKEEAVAPTAPFSLPPLPPKISDSQRGKVFSAEADVERVLRPVVVDQDDARKIAKKYGIAASLACEGRATKYFRDGRIEFGEETSLPAFLHEVAHHLTPAVFPPHGVEWVANFFKQLEKHTDYGDDYRAAFEEHGVRMTTEAAQHRARRDAVYFANKEFGCLARVVMDDPPQSEVCQLLTVGPRNLIVFDDDGEREYPLERLRYVSATLSDPE